MMYMCSLSRLSGYVSADRICLQFLYADDTTYYLPRSRFYTQMMTCQMSNPLTNTHTHTDLFVRLYHLLPFQL